MRLTPSLAMIGSLQFGLSGPRPLDSCLVALSQQSDKSSLDNAGSEYLNMSTVDRTVEFEGGLSCVTG